MIRPLAAISLALSACLFAPIAAYAAAPASPTATLSPEKQKELKKTLGEINKTVNSALATVPKSVMALVQSPIDWRKLTPEQKSFYLDVFGDTLLAANQVNGELGANDDEAGMSYAGKQFIDFFYWVRTHKQDVIAAMDKVAARNSKAATNIEFVPFNAYLTAHPKLAAEIVHRMMARIHAREQHMKSPAPAPSKYSAKNP